MPDPTDIFARHLARRRVAPETTTRYLAVARAFVASAGERKRYTREHFLTYLDTLSDKSPAWVRFAYAALRAFCEAIDQAMPVKMRELPRLRPTTQRTWLTRDQVGAMIAAVRAPAWESAEARTALALSTVYGLRVSELTTCERDGDHLVIRVAKSGQVRRQLIPKALRPFLGDVPVRTSLPNLNVLYHRIEKAAGVKHARGERSGWHTVRRSLDTALLQENRIPYAVTKAWIRWSAPGFEGPMYYFEGDPDALDRQVLKHHPFLGFWSAVEATNGSKPAKTAKIAPERPVRPRTAKVSR
jgi:hypothetical protein